MDLPAPVAPARVSRRRGRRRYWPVVGVVLALFVLFEVGIRHMPPDGMTYTLYDTPLFDSQFHPLTTPVTTARTQVYTASHDQHVITKYLTALYHGNETPSSVVDPFFRCGDALSLDKYQEEFVFTWHGIPVQSWNETDCGFMQSSGGIPNIFRVSFIGPPSTPLPPPQ